jgi:hypothetical protein
MTALSDKVTVKNDIFKVAKLGHYVTDSVENDREKGTTFFPLMGKEKGKLFSFSFTGRKEGY